MGAMTSQITSLTIVYWSVYSGADQRKHQSSASLAFVRGIHRWPVNLSRKGPVTWEIFPIDDVIMGNRGSEHVHCFSRCIPIWEQTIILTSESIISYRNYIRFDTCFIFHIILLDHIDKEALVSTMRRCHICTKQFFKSNLILRRICASLYSKTRC